VQAIRGIVRSADAEDLGPTGDAAACVAIYRPYVLETVISWEIDVPSVEEMAGRIASAQQAHEWLVLEHDGRVVGFAYGHALNRLATHRWSVETGVYLAIGHHRAGGGRALYAELLRRLSARGYRRAFAGITQPNGASTGLHRSFGFREAGVHRRVEWKHGSWHDVAWLQLDLSGADDQDGPPVPIH
jgi:L-amino acid N-acyltransferase YncA